MILRSRWASLPILMIVPLMLAACGTSSATPSSSNSKSGTSAVKRLVSGCPSHNKATGTITYSDWQFPDTLNPIQTTAAVSYQTINGLIESLFTYDAKARLVPQLAREIPTTQNGGITDGGKTVVVRLKKGLHWSNGTEITSQDIKFGWQVSMDKATGPYCTGSCDEISRIDTPDRYTARLHLKGVYAPAVPNAVPPLWPHVWKGAWNNDPHQAALKLGQNSSFDFESAKYPTMGAYQVSSFDRDNRIVLKPMKYYSSMNCGAQAKRTIFAFYSSKQGMIAAAANGKVDLTQDYTTSDLPALKSNMDSYNLSSVPSFSIEHMEMNLDPTFKGKANPLANADVRLALALSLDRIGLVQSALAVDRKTAEDLVAWTPWVKTPQLVQPYADRSITGQWDPIAKQYVIPGTSTAVKDARSLLARTQWKKGFPLSITTTTGNPTRQAQVAVALNNWNRLGIKVVPNYISATQMFSDWSGNGPLNRGNFQIAMFAFLGAPDPDGLKLEMQSRYVDRKQSTHSSINENYSGINDPVINKAFDAAAHTFNTAQRGKNYNLIQERMNKQANWITLYYRPSIATASKTLQNFSNNPTLAGPTWNMYAWKTAAAL